MAYSNEELSREFYKVIAAIGYTTLTGKIQTWAEIIAKNPQNINEVYESGGNLEVVLSDLSAACKGKYPRNTFKLPHNTWSIDIIRSIFLFGTDTAIEEIIRNRRLTRTERGKFRVRCAYSGGISDIVKKSKSRK